MAVTILGEPVLIQNEDGNILDITSTGQTSTRLHDSNGNPIISSLQGRLHISHANPITATGYTKVTQTVYQVVNGHDYVLYTPYVIPNGKNLYITKLFATGGDGGNNSVGLYFSASGIWDNNIVRLGGVHFIGGLEELDADIVITGNGTKALILKVTRRDKGKCLLGAQWEGYVEN